MKSLLSWPMLCATLLFISLNVVVNTALTQTGSCPTTPSDWYHNFGNCYYVNNSGTNFSTARRDCQLIGANLICNFTATEISYFSNILPSSCWTGLVMMPTIFPCWLRYPTCLYDITDWQTTTPDCCYVLSNVGGRQQMQPCSNNYSYICKREEIPATTTVTMPTSYKSDSPTSSKISSKASTTTVPAEKTVTMSTSSKSDSLTSLKTFSFASTTAGYNTTSTVWSSPPSVALAAPGLLPSSPIGLAVGLSVGLAAGLALIVLVVIIIYRRNRSKQQKSIQTDSTLHLQSQTQTAEEHLYETTVNPTTQNCRPATGYTELSAPTPVSQAIFAQPKRPLNRRSQNNDLTVVDNGLYSGYDDGSYHQSTNGKVDAVSSEPEYVANEVTLVDNSLYEASN